MNRLLIGTAAAVMAAGIAPAIAQTAPDQRARHMAKDHTRAEVPAMVAEHFAKMDANRDGFVTKTEVESQRQAMRAERTARRFDRLDSNSDGSISREEFEAARAQRGEAGAHKAMRRHHRMGGMHGRLLAMADSNSDGRVSLQEAQAAALRHFDMADANRDGTVTREERREMRRRHRAERRAS